MTPATAGVRRTVSVLVTDLAGSTELRVRLGEDRAQDLQRHHDTLLTTAVIDEGGIVVKGLGDGVLATFDSAADAIAAAVAIQRSARGHNRRAPDQVLGIRCGIAVGDVDIVDDDCFGTPRRARVRARRGRLRNRLRARHRDLHRVSTFGTPAVTRGASDAGRTTGPQPCARLKPQSPSLLPLVGETSRG